MEKNSLNQNLQQVSGIGTLILDNSDDALRGAANFTGISGKAMLEEMSRTHPAFVNIGGSEGYTGAETSGGGADPNTIPATEEALVQRKERVNKNQENAARPSSTETDKREERADGNRTGTSGHEEGTAGDNEAGGIGAP